MLPVAAAGTVTTGGEAVGATVGPPAPASLSSIPAYSGLLKAPQAQYRRCPCVASRTTEDSVRHRLRIHLSKKRKKNSGTIFPLKNAAISPLTANNDRRLGTDCCMCSTPVLHTDANHICAFRVTSYDGGVQLIHPNTVPYRRGACITKQMTDSTFITRGILDSADQLFWGGNIGQPPSSPTSNRSGERVGRVMGERKQRSTAWYIWFSMYIAVGTLSIFQLTDETYSVRLGRSQLSNLHHHPQVPMIEACKAKIHVMQKAIVQQMPRITH